MLRVLMLVLAWLAFAASIDRAQAWIFEDDGETWPMFSFHKYGGDVNRPAATPDRPYFHGDDAIPLGLRWRDLSEARAEAAAEDAAAEAAAAAVRVQSAVSSRRVVRRIVRRRHIARRQPVICVPARKANVAAESTAPASALPVVK